MNLNPYACIAGVLLAVGLLISTRSQDTGKPIAVVRSSKIVVREPQEMSAARYHPDLLSAMQCMAAAAKHLHCVCQDASEGEEIGSLVNTIMVLGELCEAVYPPEPDWGSDNVICVDFQSRRRA